MIAAQPAAPPINQAPMWCGGMHGPSSVVSATEFASPITVGCEPTRASARVDGPRGSSSCRCDSDDRACAPVAAADDVIDCKVAVPSSTVRLGPRPELRRTVAAVAGRTADARDIGHVGRDFGHVGRDCRPAAPVARPRQAPTMGSCPHSPHRRSSVPLDPCPLRAHSAPKPRGSAARSHRWRAWGRRSRGADWRRESAVAGSRRPSTPPTRQASPTPVHSPESACRSSTSSTDGRSCVIGSPPTCRPATVVSPHGQAVVCGTSKRSKTATLWCGPARRPPLRSHPSQELKRNDHLDRH